jgi:hypothetical protein
MTLLDKRPSDINEADLQGLIGNEPESKMIDYKRDLVGRSDGDKKEFLYDVSSFANTLGAYLVFGMVEAAGSPSELVGLADINPDTERLRLEEMLRDGIRPTIHGIEMEFVRLASGKVALVIQVPRSWTPPHQVTSQKVFRFYARNSGGKYLLDVDELRSIFAVSGTIAERIRGFRADRVAKIAAGGAPVPLFPHGIFAMHLVPFSAFDAGPSFPIDKAVRESNRFPPISKPVGADHTVTFDGLLTTSNAAPPPQQQRAYVQVFRSGALEAVTSTLGGTQGGWMNVPEIEALITSCAYRYARALHHFGVRPPIAVFVSLLNVKGKRLLQNFHQGGHPEHYQSKTLAEDQFHFVETIFEVMPADFRASAKRLRATLDHLANLAGLPKSPNFDDAGNYTLSDPTQR